MDDGEPAPTKHPEFGKWFRRAAAARGYDVGDGPGRTGWKRQLSHDVGLAESSIGRYAAGQAAPTTVQAAAKLAKGLGVTIADVLVASGQLTRSDLPDAEFLHAAAAETPPELAVAPGLRRIALWLGNPEVPERQKRAAERAIEGLDEMIRSI